MSSDMWAGGSGLIPSRRDVRDADEVFGGVDVIGTACVAAFNERDEIGVRAQEWARSGVAARVGENFGPMLAGDEDRIARPPAVASNRDAGGVARVGVTLVGCDEALDAHGGDEGLVGEGDDGGAAFVRGQRAEGGKPRRER